MRSPLRNLSLVTRLIGVGVMGIVLAAIAIAGATAWSVTRMMEENAARGLETTIGYAWDLLRQKDAYDSGFKVHDGKLYSGLTPLNDDTSVVDTIGKMTGGVASIFLGETRIATTVRRPDGARAVGTALHRGPSYDATLIAGQPFRGRDEIIGEAYVVAYDPIRDASGKVVGVLGIGLRQQPFVDATKAVMGEIIAIAAAITLLAVAASFFVMRRMLRPIGAVTAIMKRLAHDDLSVAIPDADRPDEIGQMAAAIEVFKQHGLERRRLEEERAAEEERRRAERRELLHSLADRLESSVGRVVGELANEADAMHGSSQSLSSAAAETNQRSAAVAGAATQAASNVQTVAAAAEELATSIRMIARQVSNSSEIANTAAREATATRETMRELVGAADKIGSVVQLIQEIAGRVNLLALNATIEAARAGDAGKGFGVVAAEVKTLASQTARATEDIAKHIAAIQTATGHAVDTIERISTTIAKLDEAATSVAAAVEEQEAATSEIAQSVEHAAEGTREVTHNISGVAEAAGSAGAAASRVEAAAQTLNRYAEQLRGEIDGFLSQVRAA